mmetsp:Transcript_19204/g.49601  ORF Transcript_19204/g.49601 Transcript_19204/m.49601 type:complete len:383 (-) Transcript_19204:274-1422(-)
MRCRSARTPRALADVLGPMVVTNVHAIEHLGERAEAWVPLLLARALDGQHIGRTAALGGGARALVSKRARALGVRARALLRVSALRETRERTPALLLVVLLSDAVAYGLELGVVGCGERERHARRETRHLAKRAGQQRVQVRGCELGSCSSRRAHDALSLAFCRRRGRPGRAERDGDRKRGRGKRHDPPRQVRPYAHPRVEPIVPALGELGGRDAAVPRKPGRAHLAVPVRAQAAPACLEGGVLPRCGVLQRGRARLTPARPRLLHWHDGHLRWRDRRARNACLLACACELVVPADVVVVIPWCRVDADNGEQLTLRESSALAVSLQRTHHALRSGCRQHGEYHRLIARAVQFAREQHARVFEGVNTAGREHRRLKRVSIGS